MAGQLHAQGLEALSPVFGPIAFGPDQLSPISEPITGP